jgi:hypothetical protein
VIKEVFFLVCYFNCNIAFPLIFANLIENSKSVTQKFFCKYCFEINNFSVSIVLRSIS